MAARQVLYSATTPLQGAAARAKLEESAGLVPYFVSGPLSQTVGIIGVIGTLLHVAAWVIAVIFDSMIGGNIDQDQSPGAWTYWLGGYVCLVVGFVVLLGVTVWHAFFAKEENKISVGGAPPFLMTLFIGGAQISLAFTLLTMIASSGATNNEYFYVNTSLTAKDQEDERDTQRNYLVFAMIAKVYIVHFLQNNQAWAK